MNDSATSTPDPGSAHRLELRIALAADAGGLAVDAVRQLVDGNRRVVETEAAGGDLATELRRRLLGNTRFAMGAPKPTGDQIRRACDLLDAFSVELVAVNAAIDASSLPDGTDWSARLWAADDDRARAEVHNDANDALSSLGRYRVNLVLGRPLDTPTG
ncbi:MAG: hypothetical protein AAGD35_14650 [Actinomycetota bacterium]